MPNGEERASRLRGVVREGALGSALSLSFGSAAPFFNFVLFQNSGVGSGGHRKVLWTEKGALTGLALSFVKQDAQTPRTPSFPVAFWRLWAGIRGDEASSFQYQWCTLDAREGGKHGVLQRMSFKDEHVGVSASTKWLSGLRLEGSFTRRSPEDAFLNGNKRCNSDTTFDCFQWYVKHVCFIVEI